MIYVCTICAQFQDQRQPKFVHALNELSDGYGYFKIDAVYFVFHRKFLKLCFSSDILTLHLMFCSDRGFPIDAFYRYYRY